ncbi:MAG: AAA family ATPase [Candidatus Hermodarchaeota archaeon]|nr:AAA family ATPase [Candidatus Hermodarchaeota archaeon]
MKTKKSSRSRKPLVDIARTPGDPLAQQIIPAKEVVLRPAGYPLEVNNTSVNPLLRIRDEKLFSAYAVDQWQGIKVKVDDYLFDQLLLPDFAFEVVSVVPDEAHIVADTRIRLLEPPEDAPVKGQKISFADVIGHDDAKAKCLIIQRYIAEPQKFSEWAPRRVLFYGPPGTGKTMLARALAWETQIQFFYVKATSLIGQHVGAGADKVNKLFEDAIRKKPCIVFIDEIDSIGLDRGFQSVRGDVTEVVNSLISQFDMVEEQEGIVVIAATNSHDFLDPALRSRFEEEIDFPLPDFDERLQILQKYGATLPMPLETDLESLARRTEGYSGRDLKDRVLKGALHTALAEGLESLDDSTFKHIKAIQSSKEKGLYK